MNVLGSMHGWRRNAVAIGTCVVAAAATGAMIPAAANAATSVPRCREGLDLRIGLGNSEGAAGSIYQDLTFKNITGHSCYLDGHPGVSYVGSTGNQVGSSATRTGSVKDVVVKAGHTAYATLRIVQYLNFPNCTVATVDGLRVYAPGSTAAAFVAMSGKTCSNKQILSIAAVSLTPGG
ncbi:MAG TPA: DUF4232 domain-containing protein [Sporichthyaceae bacterium]|jgi:hypothetical protein|nr:DUF4232 domain-containing protein [Sporichthyaceae bacterium]